MFGNCAADSGAAPGDHDHTIFEIHVFSSSKYTDNAVRSASLMIVLSALRYDRVWRNLMTRKLLAVFGVTAGLLCADSDAPKRLEAAADAFKEVMDVPDKAIPQDLLNKAQCVIVVPGLKKGAFIIGAKYGKGFVACRKKDGVGWTAPGAVRV